MRIETSTYKVRYTRRGRHRLVKICASDAREAAELASPPDTTRGWYLTGVCRCLMDRDGVYSSIEDPPS